MKISIPLRMAEKTYNDAINALNSLQSNYANIMAIRESGIRKNEMAISEMVEWTRRIGYTTADFNKLNIVHITGTKGKGSTAAFTNSILSQYKEQLPKIGLYTSPHLKTVRERIRINGKPLSEKKFTKYFYEIWNRLDKTSSPLDKFPHMTPGSMPGYFKFLTLLSFHTFLQEGCKSCVYEVGIGGEYDSTNIIERPVACGVSLLGIDHTFMLGDTIEEIAWNKGGIFKKHVPAFTVENQPTAGLNVLEERATERNTTVTEVPIFDELEKIKLGIAGSFQKTNASLAVALASQALTSMEILDEPVNMIKDVHLPQKFLDGLKDTLWEGRCQTVNRGNNTWYLDGAHTKDSIEAASTWFRDVMKTSRKPKVLLFNQQSRDANALIHFMNGKIAPDVHFDHVIFTTNVTWDSGSYSADLVSMNTCKEDVDELKVQKSLAEEWAKIDNESKIFVSPNIEHAINLIEGLSDNSLDIFVCGSLHLVGGLLVVFDGK
ncbi:similar to Saccharomyces cerevisiae YOR241W MET7 Folylpolyglutamate synthetase [Maudiozyma saulgeensis]|uniref:Folylpolyglutamate synthase n=1 Tax=Maudiozyma saulgeensis TaxID=1789683 RepID=A0A1X7R3R1_9SACH|nr:similar to Saccharomyces cerevisiae YOR241W MET7 Folylpolyglutamate synthetase [Kazachstania saulgeensis]